MQGPGESMNRKPELESVLRVLQELEGNILIVEGKRDVRALEALVTAWIVPINSRPIEKVALHVVSLMEKHKNTQVIVLTDFDRTGRKLAAKMRLVLQSLKIHANSRIRRDVMNLGITYVEELARVAAPALEEHGCIPKGISRTSVPVSRNAKLKERDDYGEIGANFYEVCGKGLHKGKRDNREA